MRNNKARRMGSRQRDGGDPPGGDERLMYELFPTEIELILQALEHG